MTENFGTLPSGAQARLYTITSGALTAAVTDFGATLVRLVFDGTDVVLGYDEAAHYLTRSGCAGATVGRNSNRIGGAKLPVNGITYQMPVNERANNLHSGPDFWFHRMWRVTERTENAITLSLDTPDGDQGFPGAGTVSVTYALDGSTLRITYRGIFDRDTVFNMTNHSYFNLAGHDRPEAAMDQLLTLRSARFTEVDEGSIPTGRTLPVSGTALDFTTPKALGRNRGLDPLLAPQNGIDHNFVLDGADLSVPAARLEDPLSGRVMEVYTDCPGVQVYCANFFDNDGKGGIHYPRNSGVCLETQFYPDSPNHPQWPQPTVKAGIPASSVTEFRFTKA